MKPVGYTLRVGSMTAKAVLITWLNGHTAVFKLYDELGCFRIGNVIKVNMHTLEASMYHELYGEAV